MTHEAHGIRSEMHELAASRALRISEVRNGILSHAAPSDFSRLRQVNRDFASSMNRPSVWRDEYAPAEIAWSSRTIYTAIIPGVAAAPQFDTERPRPPQSRNLGTFRGEPWVVKTGLPLQRSSSGLTDRELDRVASLTLVSHGPFAMGAAESFPGQAQEMERDRAFQFLLDRAYRLKMNQPIVIYRKEVPQLIGLVAVFADVQYLFGSKVGNLDLGNLTGWALARAEIGRLIWVMAWVSISLPLAIGTMVWAGDDMTLKNLFMGPLQRRELNTLAHRVAADLSD